MSTSTLPTVVSTGNVQVAPSNGNYDDLYADDERLFEIVKGKRVEKQMSLIENLIAAVLFGRLAPFCRENKLGLAVIETMISIPGSGNDRKPDVAFVSYNTWAADRPIPRVNAWPVAPDLIVEVISPNDKASGTAIRRAKISALSCSPYQSASPPRSSPRPPGPSSVMHAIGNFHRDELTARAGNWRTARFATF